MAKNDWIVASINNPDFTPYDFSTIAEMSLDNTQMLSEQEYLKSNFIKNHELFKDDTGNFSEKKFKQFYQHTLSTFGEFQELEFPKGPQLDMFDTDRTKDSRIKDIRFDLGRHINPDRQAVGIEGVRIWSNPTLTKSEIAQSQKIWDTAKGEFKEYSSNDKALSNGLFDWLGLVFSDPLVMALWEEDGEHIDPFTGLSKKHRKGDYKLNDKGTYYYETLNNRNPIGKEVLSVFDTLTVDGEGINKYDFFDSDDIKKSISGVIAKNVANLLPLFTPIGGVYSTILIAKEFAKAMPMLYGFATMLSDLQESPTWLNNIAAYGTKFTGSTSQYAKENLFSFENFGNLISDVALQWGLLKTIAQAINKLRGSKNYVDEAMENAKNLYKVKSKELGESEELWQVCQNRFLPDALKAATKASLLGRDASMAYMAIVSNSDLYNEMRERGLTNSEAAAIAFGSTLGMFVLNKYTKLGEIFFDDATDDAVKLARQSIKSEMSEAMTMFKAIKNSSDSPRNKLLKYMKIASDKTSGVLSKFSEDIKYHSLGFLGKAAGEGLEEVSEELISDVAKEIYQLSGYFGVDTTLKDIGAWDNMLERYSMSLIGGAIGGGIFYGKEVLIDGRSYKRDPKNAEMSILIRNGHANELRAEVEKLRKAGKLGSIKLSASKWQENEKGEKIWLTTDDIKDSQNEAIANAMLEKINALEAVINNNRIGLSDEELFNNMVFSELRYKQYEKIAPLTNYYQDFNNIITNLIAAELDLRKASETVEGTVNGETPLRDTKLSNELQSKRNELLLPLQERVNKLRKEKDEFLSGNTSLDYTRKLNFLMDPTLHSLFLPIDLEQFYKLKYGDRKWEDLNPEELIRFFMDWEEEIQTLLKANVTTSWEKYKEIENLIKPELDELAQQTPLFKQFAQQSESLFEGVLDVNKLFESYKSYEDKLDEESEEDFEFRNKKKLIDDVEESDELFKIRQSNRINLIKLYNNQKNQEWVDKVNEHLQKVNYQVDPVTYRLLQTIFTNYRNKDIIQQNLNLSDFSSNIKNIINGLSNNLDNIDEIKNLIKTSVSSEIKHQFYNSVKDIINQIKLTEGAESYIMEMSEMLDAGTIKDILNDEDDSKPELLNDLIPLLLPFVNDGINLYNLISSSDDYLNNYINKLQLDQLINEYVDLINDKLDTIAIEINNDPIFKFKQSFLNTIKNPIGELITRLSQKQGDNIPNLENILSIIERDFLNIDNVQSLILDDALMTDLEKTKNYLKLIRGFIYAASSNPDENNPFGHNQIINTFAEKNKDKLIKDWDILPEIDADYTLLYNQTIDRYVSEIDGWIKFSNENSINKIRKFVATDTAFTKALLNTIKESNFKIIIDGEEFDLLSGFSSSEDIPEIELFNAEKVLYKNFLNVLQKTGLSIEEFLNKSNLLQLLIPSFLNIQKLHIAHLSDTLQKSDLTDFDLLQYFALVFTNDPSKFYLGLKERVEKNTKVAPIIALEYSTKLAQAMINPQYRTFIKYVHTNHNVELPLLTNSIVIPGVAGAGKTSIVLSSINDPNEEIIIAGPTEAQATMLLQSLNRSSSTTFEKLLKAILGNDEYNKIKSELLNAKDAGDYNYFTIKNVNGSPTTILKKDQLSFNEQQPPKKIFLDEATHLNTLEALIIDAYAEKVGAVVYFVGDPNLQGAILSQSLIENIGEDTVFCSRTPKLAISLRDNNLQKFHNLENVRLIADNFKQDIDNVSTISEVAALLPNIVSKLSKLNFHVYNKDILNGDLIIPNLTSELITKLKIVNSNGSMPTVGFVGNSNSTALLQLREQGIEPIVLNPTQIQGQEFDYVVIDEQWELKPDSYMSCSLFISKLYTTMTRARTATIFIDNNLSTIIGNNTLSLNKSQAPSILSGVDELRKKKLEILNKMQFDISEDSEPQSVLKKNIHVDFKDPNTLQEDSSLEVVKNIIKSDNNAIQNLTEESELLLLTFTDITNVGVKVLPHETRTVYIKESNVELKDIPVWKIEHPATGVLRNLQAFYEDGTEFITYNDKLEALDNLLKLRSCIIFEHDYEKLPNLIKSKITKDEWNNRQLQLEIRKSNEYDTPHLNSGVEKYGFEYNGERYVGGIVLTITTNSGTELKFDISGLPTLEQFNDNLSTIKNNLSERIAKASGDERNKLQLQFNAVQPTFDTFNNNLETWLSQITNDNSFILNLNKSCIQFNKTTWFSKLKSDLIQLGGKLDPISGKSVYDKQSGESKTRIDRSSNNLKINHPELVFSKIYTYANDKLLIEGIDPKIAGKAVVFVSSDKTLLESDLLPTYINQKLNPNDNTPVVRMLLLGNYGMTFDQFIDPNFFNEFTSESERKPLRQNFNGLRMFVSLWNWRASLKQFKQAFDIWLKENKYSEDQINALVQAAQAKYDEQEYDSLLQKNNLSEKDLDELDDFNNKICKDIPIFRLGFSTNGNGFYVSLREVNNSAWYKNTDKVNLLIINPDTINNFEYLLDRTLSLIVPHEKFNNVSLGVQLKKEDGSTWDDHELITFDDAKILGTLSGLLSATMNTITISNGDRILAFQEGELWSSIPLCISLFVRAIDYHARNSDFHNYLKTTIQVQTTSGSNNIEILIDDVLKANSNAAKDLRKLMSLVFHGTVEDVHDKPLQVEDAYYKNGFYINPDISRKRSATGDNDIVSITNADGLVLFYEIDTSDELFTVDTNVRSSGIGIILNKLNEINISTEKVETEESSISKENDFEKTYPDFYYLIQEYNQLQPWNPKSFDIYSVDEVAHYFNDLCEINIKNKLLNNLNCMSDTFKYITEDGTIIKQTFEEYIKQTLDIDSFTIENQIIKTDDKLWKITPFLTFDDITPLPSELNNSHYKLIIDGEPAIDYIIKAIDNNKDAIKNEETEENEEHISDYDINKIKDKLKDIFDLNNDTDIQNALNELMKNDGTFIAILTVIQSDEKINKIFENCS